MTVKKKQIIECDVIDVAFGGKGLAKIDGFAVFIDQTVTGDRVAARIIKKKRNYAEAVVQELLTPSPMRVEPPCSYSGFCGGCKWQFIDYPYQITLKRRHVAESLEHIALINGTHRSSDAAVRRYFRLPQQNGVFLLGPALADAP
jgi:23S rRNA (uracil1939-C5)-methyltransferase